MTTASRPANPTATASGLDVEASDWVSVETVCQHVQVSVEWIEARWSAGLLPAERTAEGSLRLPVQGLKRARTMASIEDDFDAVPELAALVADLREELARVRGEVQRLSAQHRLLQGAQPRAAVWVVDEV